MTVCLICNWRGFWITDMENVFPRMLALVLLITYLHTDMYNITSSLAFSSMEQSDYFDTGLSHVTHLHYNATNKVWVPWHLTVWRKRKKSQLCLGILSEGNKKQVQRGMVSCSKLPVQSSKYDKPSLDILTLIQLAFHGTLFSSLTMSPFFFLCNLQF